MRDDDEGATHLRRSGLSAQAAPDPPGRVSGAYGLPDSLATAGRSHWAALFPVGTGSAALSPGGDAAGTYRPTVLQPQRPSHGIPPPPRGQALLYEAELVRRFARLRLSEPIPDKSTILHFRHLLERHDLGQGLLDEINAHLESQGLKLREETIVDATIIEAPSSTRNRSGQRDPEMRQVKKGNQYHFGMKLHIGVDAETGLVHSLRTTSANVHDVTEAHRLLHGGEQ